MVVGRKRRPRPPEPDPIVWLAEARRGRGPTIEEMSPDELDQLAADAQLMPTPEIRDGLLAQIARIRDLRGR